MAMAVCEFVGGPRDGERFSVPGTLPPETIRVLDTTGNLQLWHVAAIGHPDYQGVAVVICHLEDVAGTGKPNSPWRYVWPRIDTSVAPQ